MKTMSQQDTGQKRDDDAFMWRNWVHDIVIINRHKTKRGMCQQEWVINYKLLMKMVSHNKVAPRKVDSNINYYLPSNRPLYTPAMQDFHWVIILIISVLKLIGSLKFCQISIILETPSTFCFCINQSKHWSRKIVWIVNALEVNRLTGVFFYFRVSFGQCLYSGWYRQTTWPGE